MDDIDDLLDEVESKFCCEEPKNREKKPNPKPVQQIAKKNSSLKQDSLEDMINEIIADDGLDDTLKNKFNTKRVESPIDSNDTSNVVSKLKCYPVFVSGTAFQYGSITNMQQSICNQLHCTSCDNKIVTFDNVKWSDADCDYLVFRNNYPDFTRLKSKLIPRTGYRAYCCQCSWLSAKGSLELKAFKPHFKWICGKH